MFKWETVIQHGVGNVLVAENTLQIFWEDNVNSGGM